MKIKATTGIAFLDFYKKEKETKIPFSTGYKLKKIFDQITKELEFYYTSLQQIIETYTEKDTAGNIKVENGNYIIQKDKIQECNEKLAELDQIELEVSDTTFTAEELINFEVTIETMEALAPFIKE